MLTLFGEEAEPTEWTPEWEIRRYDRETELSRADRLRFVLEVYPDESYHWFDTLEAYHLFREAKMTFVNGQFAATVLIAQCVIERTINERLGQRIDLPPRPGLFDVLQALRDHELAHPFLIERIDRLRRARNPFVHLLPFENANTLSQRELSESNDHFEIVEANAREALALMYQVWTTRI